MQHNDQIAVSGKCACACHHGGKCTCGLSKYWLAMLGRPAMRRVIRSEKLGSRVQAFQRRIHPVIAATKEHAHHALRIV